jgi:hypothetical protein
MGRMSDYYIDLLNEGKIKEEAGDEDNQGNNFNTGGDDFRTGEDSKKIKC